MNWSFATNLVRRGEILLGFDIINNWDKELKEMNKKIKSENHFIIQTLFFIYFVMLMCNFIYHICKPRELYKGMLNEKYKSY